MCKAALEAGKHVLCEKPFTITSGEARELVDLAAKTGLANCIQHNLRYYPVVQQIRRMIEAGELGEILIVQGTYSQDWLLYDTDWNWRIDSKANGPLRAMGDIGSHWMDMIQHLTGLKIAAVCADFATFHKTRKKPKGSIETFAGKTLKPEDYQAVPIDTEDFARGAVASGRSRARLLHRQPDVGRAKEYVHGRYLWNQSGCFLESGTARRAVDRPAQHAEWAAGEGSVAARSESGRLCRSYRAGTVKATTTLTSRYLSASTLR